MAVMARRPVARSWKNVTRSWPAYSGCSKTDIRSLRESGPPHLAAETQPVGADHLLDHPVGMPLGRQRIGDPLHPPLAVEFGHREEDVGTLSGRRDPRRDAGRDELAVLRPVLR